MSEVRPDVVGLGLATVDILTLVPRLPGRDEVYQARDIRLEGGGPVATALVAACRLGASTAYLGPIAPTTWGALTREGLESAGVDTHHAPTRVTGEQAKAVILVDQPTGYRSILYKPASMPDLVPAEVPEVLITSARALHLDGVHLEAALYAAAVARETGVLVSFDGGVGELWHGVESLLPLVDLLIVARRFAELHTGEPDPVRAAPALLERLTPRPGSSRGGCVVITDGPCGSWYWDGEQQLHQPAYAVDVVDTTGAGDVFHGAYLYSVLQGWAPQRSLAFASAAAALKCQRLGGRDGIPSLQDVEALLVG